MAETAHYGAQTRTRRVTPDALYAVEPRGQDIAETFIEARNLTAITVRELTTRIVHGVAEHQERVDMRISTALDKSWTLERTPAADRDLARIAIFEMDHTDTPGSVVIAGTMGLAQELSTDGSPGFLNGLLSKALSIKKANS